MALLVVAVIFEVACSDTYRPIAQPIPGQSPTPAAVGHINVVSTNGTSPGNPQLGPGSLSRIDVSGDSVISGAQVGMAPGIAALGLNTRVYVPNSLEDSVFVSPTTNASAATINLAPLCNSTGTCPPVFPVFATSTENNRMYVAGAGNGSVSVIDTSSNVVVRTFAVNPIPGQTQPQPDTISQPVALAELPNGSKIYTVNKGSNSVSSLNTLDGTLSALIPVGPQPVWAVANSDNLHVYVADSAGSIWVIDTRTEAASQVSFGTAGANPNYIAYDKAFNRVYAIDANLPQPALAIYDVTTGTGTPGSTLAHHGSVWPVPITPVAGTPCSTSPATQNAIPTSVAVLGDGSRAYVSSYQRANGFVCTQVTVVDAASARVTKSVPLSIAADNAGQTDCDKARFRAFAASSLGGTNSLFKVYVSQCDAGTVAILDTAPVTTGPNQRPADSLAGWLPSPVSSFAGSQISISSVSQVHNSSTVTFTYGSLNGPPIQVGMTVYISGLPHLNGGFVIDSISGSTFTVTSNATPPTVDINDTNQNGSGSVIPPQNPVFLVPAT